MTNKYVASNGTVITKTAVGLVVEPRNESPLALYSHEARAIKEHVTHPRKCKSEQIITSTGIKVNETLGRIALTTDTGVSVIDRIESVALREYFSDEGYKALADDPERTRERPKNRDNYELGVTDDGRIVFKVNGEKYRLDPDNEEELIREIRYHRNKKFGIWQHPDRPEVIVAKFRDAEEFGDDAIKIYYVDLPEEAQTYWRKRLNDSDPKRGRLFDFIARAYFNLHPAQTPWKNPQPNEVWKLEVQWEIDEPNHTHVALVDTDGHYIVVHPKHHSMRYLAPSNENITHGTRLNPAEVNNDPF